MNHNMVSSRFRIFLGYITAILVILLISLALFNSLLNPPMSDFGLMAQFLAITAIVSAFVGFIAYRFGWVQKSPSLRLTLLSSYLLASLLTFFNVWVTAKLMFASEHDLMLATVLMLFAGGIAMVLGFFLSTTITDRIRRLERAASRIQDGNLDVRVPVEGNDEMANLAISFNQMAAKLNESAEKQRQLETLRHDLIAWIGHDLQTPLASVRAILEALSDKMIDDPETIQRYLHTAQRDIRNLSLLIDDLFQMAQLDAGGLKLHLESASLNDLISDTLESFSTLSTRKKIHLAGYVEPGIDPVFMDVQRIGRVLNNLINNAIRHTPNQGRVEVDVSSLDEGVKVEVRDTGSGIPTKDLPYIFDRFYRGEKSRSRLTGGSGLGLAIAKGVIEAHGGDIGVESSPGGGACFYFTLPNR